MPPELAVLHPLVLYLAGHLAEDAKLGLTAARETLDGIQHALLALEDRDDLRRALRDILAFAFSLERKQRSSALAGELIAMINAPTLIAKLGAFQAERVQTLRRFKREELRAPVLGARTPAGTIKVDHLGFRKRA